MPLRLSLIFAVALVLLLVGAASAGANRGLPAKVAWFEDPEHEPGTLIPGAYVTQQRGYFSITAQMHLRELTPGHRYTLWWVIYNNPSACVDGCDQEDVNAALATGANPVGIGVHYGGTFVATSAGKLDVGTRILEDAVTACQNSAPYAALCEPLVDAAVAQATIIIHDHGPGAVDKTVDVADAFATDCKNYKRFDTVVATYATTGYECFSPQSVFLP